jgi:hypothetical protein
MRTRASWDIRPPIYSAGAARGMEIAEAEPWTPLGAMDRMLDDAGIGGDTPDYDEAKRGFLIHDLANPDQRVGYELPIADVFPCGRKKVHPAALEQAERDLRNHRAPDDIRAAALAVIDHYNQRIRRPAQAAQDNGDKDDDAAQRERRLHAQRLRARLSGHILSPRDVYHFGPESRREAARATRRNWALR